MSIEPWRATCVQITSRIASHAQSREEAWAIIEGNLANAVAEIEAACDGPNPPRLVVLPEFALQGPPRATPTSAWIERACATIPGPITDRLAEVARSRGIYVAGNHFEVDPRWPDRCFNSSFVLDPSGEVILRYRRINTASWTSPHDILDEYRAAYGEEALFPVADTELGRLAIFPCGEMAVPEIARMFMLSGAEVLLHPNNEPARDLSDAAKLCRAAENMCYVVSANVAGIAGFSDSEEGGRSQIIDFTGARVAYDPSADQGHACSALIDVAALQAARRDPQMGNPLLRARFAMYRDRYAAAELYPTNALPGLAFETLADLAALNRTALANMERAGLLRA
jgi:predicted amidohydrolase